MNVISINQLVKVYNSYKAVKAVPALDSISFAVTKGEFTGIMGPSGSGKTTLLNILSGVDKATSGEVLIDGQDITKLSKDEMALFRRERIGYVFQDFNLLDSLTLAENISLPLILDRKSPKEIEDKLGPLLQLLDIEELKDKYPYHLSGGQKQRAAAARAIVNEPAVILADEPTGNLDSRSAGRLMETMASLNGQLGSTILMVTHDPFAASFCQRVIFIKDGQFEFEIRRGGGRKLFFDRILEAQSVLGGKPL
ncbi:ABC transporter ATP-binding protein [Paenibacillus sp. MMS20-IR301]|uniref:ABC transporter ATP-binding protein n=1 Tax=Paenibacillus sp. MMS20-IR301 TaxID=2895946 RepID=UPI0028EF89B4|nr:ABC transporter ATP-binding protein [Paenibacillus sp. MMS20-IR301]WNS43162.1 ABC transporter ATP-binding protein [Paenibacillus sp. MMS20-IR301]